MSHYYAHRQWRELEKNILILHMVQNGGQLTKQNKIGNKHQITHILKEHPFLSPADWLQNDLRCGQVNAMTFSTAKSFFLYNPFLNISIKNLWYCSSKAQKVEITVTEKNSVSGLIRCWVMFSAPLITDALVCGRIDKRKCRNMI